MNLEDLSPEEIIQGIAQYMAKRGVPHYSVYFNEGRWQLLGPKSPNVAGALRQAADSLDMKEKPEGKLN